jgi:hypothetical protein
MQTLSNALEVACYPSERFGSAVKLDKAAYNLEHCLSMRWSHFFGEI